MRAGDRNPRRGGSLTGVQAAQEFQQAGAIGGAHFGKLDAESAAFFRKAHDSLHADFSFMEGKEHLQYRSHRHGVARGDEHTAGAQIADPRYDAWSASRPCDPYSLCNRNANVAAVIFGGLCRHLFFEERRQSGAQAERGAAIGGKENGQFVCAQVSYRRALGKASSERRPRKPTLPCDSGLVHSAKQKIKSLCVERYRR